MKRAVEEAAKVSRPKAPNKQSPASSTPGPRNREQAGQLHALLDQKGPFDLITAQRVIINCRFNRREAVLRE